MSLDLYTSEIIKVDFNTIDSLFSLEFITFIIDVNPVAIFSFKIAFCYKCTRVFIEIATILCKTSFDLFAILVEVDWNVVDEVETDEVFTVCILVVPVALVITIIVTTKNSWCFV